MSIYYQDDQVTLYHGDALTEHRKWLAADALVTDPPYGVEWTGHKGSYRKTGEFVVIDHKPISGDHDAAARDKVLDLWGRRPAVVFGSWRTPRPKSTKHRLIWHKKGQAPGPLNAAFMLQDEEIYILGDGFRKSSPPLRSVIATTEARSVEAMTISHPTPKPIGLMETLIDRCPEGVIADPFAGSGSTLVAARNLGRKAVGVEIDESYCEIAAMRLSQGAFDFSALT